MSGRTGNAPSTLHVGVGTWKLRVQDTAAQDTGTLNGWKLTF